MNLHFADGKAVLPLLDNRPGQFTAALAHEVRNPLANINLSVEMLQTLVLDEEMKLYLDIIMRSSGRINALVRELLEYQQADEAEAGSHSVQELLNDVLDAAQDRIMLKHITVRKNYGTDDCHFLMNRPQLQIALTNIVVNAIDAMGVENGVLKLVTASKGNDFMVRIEDNGCGISKVNLKRIFKAYFTSKPGGLGLGLAATYDILKLNRVQVKVASKVGRGTHFMLLFTTVSSVDELPDLIVLNGGLVTPVLVKGRQLRLPVMGLA